MSSTPRLFGRCHSPIKTGWFRKVTLADANRGGLLGQGSLLTVTSYPNRTSVVQRGKWILENLLGTPPPPPPPDVPELKAAPHGKLPDKLGARPWVRWSEERAHVRF